MAARTVLRKVDLRGYVPIEDLDRAFNKSGLCAYCENRQNCSLCERSGFVFECEEYQASADEAPELTFTTIGMIQDEEEAEILSGLCEQCQRRDICPLKFIRGGVWHCEEFQ
ncbi:MAG TPA: hypothetical protein PL124_08075 [Candidatus Cloacimonadota bacterium]|nr:hypothetical protein [Candidatus Cloacimonadota bacterium]